MHVIDKIARHKIAKNTSVLVVSQIATRVLSIFYAAALARYVGTEGVGKISTAIAVNSILVLMVVPGLKTLLVRDVAADARKADAYVSNMIFLRVLLGVPFILLTAIVAHVAGYPNDTVLIVYVYTLVYLLDALSEVLAAVFQAFECMEYEAASQVVQRLVNISLSLLAIYLGWSLLAIAWMSVVARVCQLLMLIILVHRRFVRLRPAVSWSTSKRLFLSSLPFAAWLIFAMVQVQLGPFVISLCHTADAVGIYSAAYTLIGILLFLPSAFSSAIYPTFSRLHVQARHDLPHFYQLCYKYIPVVGFPLGMGTILVGDRVITLVYGDDFEGSAAVIRILGLFLFTIVGYSNGGLLNATGRQRFFAWTEGLALVANVTLCLLLVPTWGPVGAAIALTASGVAVLLIRSIACHRQLGLSFPWLTTGKTLLATLLMGAAVSTALQAGVPWLVVAFTVAPSVYGLSLLLLGIVRRDELRILASAPSSSRSIVGSPTGG
jgi:O-antigen/teichoic acid export membrane protein